ncbi:hypothetical protein MMC10_011166, partial [Thelotrema lepadinum]|nr:hypothetical protein [Thelotrema lepadinum]
MVYGEYESMKSIYEVVPSFAPRPIACGSCQDPEWHFILFTFYELDKEKPAVSRFTFTVGELHNLSRGRSPEGKFGFHVVTYNGTLPQDNTWTDTWEEFYVRGMQRMLALEKERRGPSEDLKHLSEPFLSKVIPRLLRPMETQGRRVEPVLIHGDLWIGNVSTQRQNQEPLMFDASAFWGHNE